MALANLHSRQVGIGITILLLPDSAWCLRNRVPRLYSTLGWLGLDPTPAFHLAWCHSSADATKRL